MAITTLDGIIAGALAPRYFFKALSGTLVAGRPYTPWYVAGIPGAGTAPASGLNGSNLTSPTNGQIPFTNPGSGNSYLARFSGDATQTGMLMLVDRLWQNVLSPTTTTAQSITQPTLPARDAAGSTNGDGVLVGLEIVTATGAGVPTPSISYTNQSGTASRTASLAVAYTATSPAGTFYPFALQAGDTGVRSIQSYTASVSMTSGAVSLVAYRILATIDLGTFAANALGPIDLGFPQIYNDTVPQLIFIPSTTTTSILAGTVTFAQG